VPDESTVLRFRHLLEAHALGEKLFQQVHVYLERQGIKIGTGTIVDATIISAPPSTKNKDKDKRRDPDMHQTKPRPSSRVGRRRSHCGYATMRTFGLGCGASSRVG
jgi:IS5 family transposase